MNKGTTPGSVSGKVAIFFQKVAEKLPKFFCFSYLFWVLKIKNSHIASYQNFICQSPMIISEVLSISLDQQINSLSE